MIKMRVTLTDDEGHKRRSKVTKNELINGGISQTIILTNITPSTKVQPEISDI